MKEQATRDEKELNQVSEEKPKFYGAITGLPLDTEKVLAARREEMDYVRKRRPCSKCQKKECREVTGANLVGVKWVDVDKGPTQGYRVG